MTEAEFQTQIVKLAKALGWRVYHHDSRRSNSGYPDLTLAKPGVGVMYVDLKSDNGSLSAAQKDWARDLRDAGEHFHLFHPNDWDAVVTALELRCIHNDSESADCICCCRYCRDNRKWAYAHNEKCRLCAINEDRYAKSPQSL